MVGDCVGVRVGATTCSGGLAGTRHSGKDLEEAES